MVSLPEPLRSSITGITIPVLGFGTAAYPSAEHKTIRDSILHAIKLGYRHFDTAAVYQTEEALGEAILEALSLALIKSRDELFITSKLWCSDAHSQHVLPALQNTLKKLKLEFLDLYLIRWPVSLKPGKCEFPFPQEDLLPMDFKSVWEAMEECQKFGLAKHIAVSSFSCKKLETLLATAKIPPAINQVEMNPLWLQKRLREFCEEKGIEEKGILITAYSPLGGPKGTPWGTNQVMQCEVLKEIADAKGKTIAQICLRWAYEQGVSFVMKSFDKTRMEENFNIFDWKLMSPEELQKITQIPQQKGWPALDFIADNGPYKCIINGALGWRDLKSYEFMQLIEDATFRKKFVFELL